MSEPGPARAYVTYSRALGRRICQRVAAGETLRAICAEPDMPSTAAVRRWAQHNDDFAEVYRRARAAASQWGHPNSTFCPLVAQEIVTRVSEGESLSAIAEDPAMPSMGTIFYWRRTKPEFAEDLRTAREALAERFSDLGWRMAEEATTETVALTRLRLGQLRWHAAVLAPRTHARLRPAEPPKEQEVQTIIFKHFEVETHPETGQHRVITYRAEPGTMRVELQPRGPWIDPVDPIAKAAAIEAATGTRAVRARQSPPEDSEGWR